MARFGLVGPSYRSRSILADCQTCMNLYLEAIESGQGKSAAALYQRGGLNKLYDLGQAGVRGSITAQGRTFEVAGTTLWELLPPTSKAGDAGTNRINRGQVVSDGQPVSMASGPTQVLIASAGNLYCYQLAQQTKSDGSGMILAANTLAVVPQFDKDTRYGLLATSVAQVVFSDGFFQVFFTNSNQIQCSNPDDGSSWQGVSETQVSVFSDNIVAIYIFSRLLVVLGPKNIQVYFNSGNFPYPYDIVQGGFMEQGIAAPFSVAKLDNSVFWLGQGELGAGMVWRANGYTPVRVSTHAIEYALSTYPTIADAVCYGYQDQGHTFYVMNFPTAQKSWVYDCATQAWHERGFWSVGGGNGKFLQDRAGFHTFNFGLHLVGDPTTGAVYQQSTNILSDFGNPIRRVRTAPHLSNEQVRTFYSELQLDIENGLATFPGTDVSTVIPVLDAAGVLRNFLIEEGGILAAPVTPGGDPTNGTPLFLNDAGNTTSWQITISPVGAIEAVQLPEFIDSYPQAIHFVSAPEGKELWTLQLMLAGANAILQTIPQGNVERGAQIMLDWSNDGGRSWSDPRMLDCGQTGDTIKRIIARQLGSGRDRVFRITMTDAAPLAIIDGYLFTDPEDKQPTSRYASELRKRA